MYVCCTFKTATAISNYINNYTKIYRLKIHERNVRKMSRIEKEISKKKKREEIYKL